MDANQDDTSLPDLMGNSVNRPRMTPSVRFLRLLVEMVGSRFGFVDGLHIVRHYPTRENGGPQSDYFSDTGQFSDLRGVMLNRVSDDMPNWDESVRPSRLVFGAFPIEPLRRRSGQTGVFLDRVVGASRTLSDDGIGIFVIERFHRACVERNLQEVLEAEGIYVLGLINVPKRFFLGSPMQPVVLIVSRRQSEFVSVLDCPSIEDLQLNIENFFIGHDTDDPKSVLRMRFQDFPGFQMWYALRKVDNLQTDYDSYERIKVGDVSLSFTRCPDDYIALDEEENSVFLPRIGSGGAVTKSSQLTMSSNSYFHIVVNSARTTSTVLCSYVNSQPFRLIYGAEQSIWPSGVPTEIVLDLPVRLPSLDVQVQLKQDIEKLARLRLLIDEVARDITVNRPPSQLKMQKVDDALNVFGKLTAEDRILALVRGGESKTVEFKQTFSVPKGDDLTVPTKEIEKSTLKNIAGFLNTDGGVVFIGVHDDGRILGVEEEMKLKHGGKRDDFLLHVRNAFDKAVEGKNPGLRRHGHLINYDTVEVQGKLILQIECARSPIPVFLGKEFCVKRNPAVVALEGEDLLNYVEHRFKGSPPAVLG